MNIQCDEKILIVSAESHALLAQWRDSTLFNFVIALGCIQRRTILRPLEGNSILQGKVGIILVQAVALSRPGLCKFFKVVIALGCIQK